jgi:hypothetical protein
MRILAVCIVLLALSAGSASGAPDDSLTVAEKFVEHFADTLERKQVQVTEQQRDALLEIHPLLLAWANSTLVEAFWGLVRFYEATEIDEERAEELIRKGKIRSIMWFHSLALLDEINGRRYSYKGPRRDLERAVEEVDPTGVFIGQGWE